MICNLEKSKLIKKKIESENKITTLNIFLKVLSDKTRLKIILCLLEDSCCQTEIVSALDISKSLASHQLKILLNHNIISSSKKGRHVIYSIYDHHISELINILTEHLNEEKK